MGVTALLPWIVEAAVGRLGTGAPSWQLAVRRLQLNSGTAARTVNGIAVAVAGAIALQMLFAGVDGSYTRSTGNDLSRAQMEVYLPAADSPADAARRLTAGDAVREATPLSVGMLGERAEDPQRYVELTVGTCDALRVVARVPACRDGDVFVVRDREYDDDTIRTARPGHVVYVDPGYAGAPGRGLAWHLPAGLKEAHTRADPSGYERGGVLVTPGALPRPPPGRSRAGSTSRSTAPSRTRPRSSATRWPRSTRSPTRASTSPGPSPRVSPRSAPGCSSAPAASCC